MTTRPTNPILLLATLLLAGGLGCATPATTHQAAAHPQTREDNPPPTFLKSGRHNPEASPAI